MKEKFIQILIVGGGNAGLTAAITAALDNREVLLIEKAPIENRGGNSALTMNFRFAHNSLEELLELIDYNDQSVIQTEKLQNNYQSYSSQEFFHDLIKTSENNCNVELAQVVSNNSKQTINWLRQLGHKWEYKPNILHGSVPIRLKGGGAALQQHNFSLAQKFGVEILYQHRLIKLIGKEKIESAIVLHQGEQIKINAKAIILACGGFEANSFLRKKYLGNKWENIAIRGVPYNTGEGILAAFEIGAQQSGNFCQCHASPQDSHLPQYMLPKDKKWSQTNSRYAFNYGLLVNKEGKRFVDEGQDLPNFVYAKLGASILDQTNKIAFQIFDFRKIKNGLVPKTYFTSRNYYSSNSLHELANKLEVDNKVFVKTIEEYNKSLIQKPQDTYDLDSASTSGILPPKSNWATSIDSYPFFGFPVKAGLTFTYGGLKIDNKTQVYSKTGTIIRGLYACGEIVGGLFTYNYPGGAGLMAGSVFGRIAGKSAVEYISSSSV